MTTPVFTNNAETTIAVTTTASATTIEVADASIFNVLIQDGAGATNDAHEMATLSDGTNIEVVKVTNAATGTDIITVVREQEGTTGFAFLTDDSIKLDITAQTLMNGFFGRAPNDYSAVFGLYAIDLVTYRTLIGHAASGDYSIAAGYTAKALTASSIAIGYLAACEVESYTVAIGSSAHAGGTNGGANAVAIGRSAYCESDDGVAIGRGATCNGTTGADDQIAIGHNADCGTGNNDGVSATAIGYNTKAFADYCTIIGDSLVNYIDKIHRIAGPSLIGKDQDETDELLIFSGQENIIFSQEYDFTLTAADNIITIEIPTGSTFFISEVGFMPTVVDTRTIYPTLEFGSNTTTDAIMTATAVSTETVRKRERFSETLNNTNWVAGADETGHTTQLTVSVTVAATATSFSGRCYFKGMLLEDE